MGDPPQRISFPMDTFQKFYLRLVLTQGICLALGFCLNDQLQQSFLTPAKSLTPQHISGESAKKLLNPRFKITSAAILGTWGLLAGISGWLVMREQRRQLLVLLKQHDDAPATSLRVLNDVQFSSEELQEPEVFSIEPVMHRLRLAMNSVADSGDEERNEEVWAEEDPCERVSSSPLRLLT